MMMNRNLLIFDKLKWMNSKGAATYIRVLNSELENLHKTSKLWR